MSDYALRLVTAEERMDAILTTAMTAAENVVSLEVAKCVARARVYSLGGDHTMAAAAAAAVERLRRS